MSDLYTTIKTDQGDVKIKQDDNELQKVVSLIYSMDQEINQLEADLDFRTIGMRGYREKAREYKQEIDQLKAQIEKMKNCESCRFNTPSMGIGKCDACSRINLRNKEDNWELVFFV